MKEEKVLDIVNVRGLGVCASSLTTFLGTAMLKIAGCCYSMT